MKKITLFFLLFIFKSSLNAVGTTSGLILLKNPSARAQSLAESFSSVGADEGGVTALHYNPASLAYLKAPSLAFSGQKGVLDDYFTAVYFGIPTQFGIFSANAHYTTLGEIELINTAGESQMAKAQRDWVFQLNYAETLSDLYATGVAFKLIHSNLVNNITANAFAVDFGNQVRLLQNQFALGFSIQNIGSKLTYKSVSEPLPLVIRGGLSYRHPIEIIRDLRYYAKGELLTSLDFIKEQDTDLKKTIGLQYVWDNSIAIRGGYKFGQDLGNLNFGIGIFTKLCHIDYSISDEGALGVSHLATLTYFFPKELFQTK